MAIQKDKVLLGVTGGIAAYKTPDLVRKLTAKNTEVRAVLTASAEHFVSPLALQAVSGNPVSNDLLDPAAEAAMGHIELAKWADTILIAPATANFIAKLAHGMADDLLSTLCLASSAKIFVAPAMNQQMWKAEATQANLAILAKRGITIIPPDSGEQACGDVGQGRMPEPQYLAEIITQPKPLQLLAGKKMVITAGPTREAIDPVRYISNHSSGKMGYALANAAIAMGAKVTLVSGPVNITAPDQATLVKVESALQMHDAVMGNIQGADIFIGCAAVADYRPSQAVNQKIKKNNQELTLTFTKNPDILADVAKQQRSVFTVGFAAETQDVSRYAKDKLQRKQLDMIAANDVSNSDIGFNSEQNALTVFWKEGEKSLEVADKRQLAFKLMQLVSERYKDKHATQ
ncbi:bifunctional phosphopantothenoylcysteine decarboxylase/phosphopantothenate--cysteine ligase CoaBC [Aliiglaciecola sp. 3_MG-2023]|uniref:bifunctional phosphopantothenoylcysteine decarboxylase/phosphopantothenate--cysteine ligase CoaBC n=1 Tax=Aliiglaciecola sp. 3_MG-2023 TaxID=3062644 RepID=UPI0026E32F92|nr:bifunctional phosphopantothenoylcysteine decarboxylase/phosphopantothenate--cysteine ligase CoaBC [Aliiglaciecola sp. 3_MG-2023]MDO6692989.1 bifunctional phosphopantothenoylcysteine decarboxylase/phosphopantothenate--cysteine ligase CoaBC [Aliiglaciecola sp. 3_MG-2023]